MNKIDAFLLTVGALNILLAFIFAGSPFWLKCVSLASGILCLVVFWL
jgi:hypothetical protein